jgi:hypothetical protein
MVTNGLRMTVCAILLMGVASHAIAQQPGPAAASDLSRAASFTDALDTYAVARSAFDRKDYSAAAVQFERTLALLDDVEKTARSSAAADLALLTSGFLDLSRALAGDPQRHRPNVGGGGPRLAH